MPSADSTGRLQDGTGAWKTFPSNRPGFGSINSENNRQDINTPDPFVDIKHLRFIIDLVC